MQTNHFLCRLPPFRSPSRGWEREIERLLRTCFSGCLLSLHRLRKARDSAVTSSFCYYLETQPLVSPEVSAPAGWPPRSPEPCPCRTLPGFRFLNPGYPPCLLRPGASGARQSLAPLRFLRTPFSSPAFHTVPAPFPVGVAGVFSVLPARIMMNLTGIFFFIRASLNSPLGFLCLTYDSLPN